MGQNKSMDGRLTGTSDVNPWDLVPNLRQTYVGVAIPIQMRILVAIVKGFDISQLLESWSSNHGYAVAIRLHMAISINNPNWTPAGPHSSVSTAEI